MKQELLRNKSIAYENKTANGIRALMKQDCLYSLGKKKDIVHTISFLKSYSATPETARSTFPERRQEVHTYIFFVPPSTLTLTDFTFAFHILLDLLCEWLT